uniref:Uncharacterized protein n=1 Tax=Anguilla anguilla TaxID=7936 RepID=A0A0E9RU69_ANGAN
MLNLNIFIFGETRFLCHTPKMQMCYMHVYVIPRDGVVVNNVFSK